MVFPATPRQADGKHRSFADRRSHIDAMIEELREALDDGEPQSEAFPPVALRIVQLVELLKDLIVTIGRNTLPRIPDFDADIRTSAPAPEQDTPCIRVADSVGNQIANQTREQ